MHIIYKFTIIFGTQITYQILLSTITGNNTATNTYLNNSYIRLMNEREYVAFKKILKAIGRGTK